jgi:hypothetical protein
VFEVLVRRSVDSDAHDLHRFRGQFVSRPRCRIGVRISSGFPIVASGRLVRVPCANSKKANS